MGLTGNERSILEGRIKSLKLYETVAESDEDPGIDIDSDILLR